MALVVYPVKEGGGPLLMVWVYRQMESERKIECVCVREKEAIRPGRLLEVEIDYYEEGQDGEAGHDGGCHHELGVTLTLAVVPVW